MKTSPSFRVIGHWALIAVFVAIIIVGVLIALRLFLGDRSPELPVEVSLIESGIKAPLCPGDIITTTARVNIKRPLILNIVVSVADQNGLSNVVGTQMELEPRPHPRRGSFRQHLTWRVPLLPPASYLRVTAYHSLNSETEPEFLEVPFVIKEGCDE